MKLIIDIPNEAYKYTKTTSELGWLTTSEYANAIKNGIPLDSNSERAEVQAYFDGEAYGWEQGRKALIDDVKAEIEQIIPCDKEALSVKLGVLEIIDKYTGKTESEKKT